MAADQPQTAEQKLLKMIETSSADEASQSKGKKKAGGRGSLAFLKTINRLLILGIFAAGFFLFQEVNAGSALMKEELDLSQVRVASRSKGTEALMPTVQKLSYYTAPLNRRNLFEPYEHKVQQVVEVTDKNKEAATRAGHLKLVGISWMDTIQSASVMLEDTSKEVTYFLQKNESLGDINVKTIYADSVELGFEDEEIMIRYETPQQ